MFSRLKPFPPPRSAQNAQAHVNLVSQVSEFVKQLQDVHICLTAVSADDNKPDVPAKTSRGSRSRITPRSMAVTR